MERMLLLLRPAPAQEKALAAELAELEDPSSPEYHHWLTPSEFASSYANSASDVAALAAWLESEGFAVAALPAGRGWIEFSGTVAQVEQSFHTQIDLYATAEGARAALAQGISVPGAFAPLISGLVSLDGAVSRPSLTTPSVVPVSAATLAAEQSLNGAQAMTPQLAAQMLHLNALRAEGEDGAGESIAIAATSDVNRTDVAAFRAAFGQPASAVEIVANGADPGVTGGQAETTVMASWAGAAAPGAQILVVPAGTTAATDGADLSLAEIVDQDLAQIAVVGNSECEAAMSAAHQEFYPALYRQAAAEGITVIAAAGDSGAAACHAAGSTAPVSTGLAVNGFASTPWDTAVGVAGFSTADSSPGGTALAAWSPLSASDPAYAGGGGSSTLYAGPAWQPIPVALSQGAGGTGVHDRLMPDVSLPTAMEASGNPGLAFCLSGAEASGGGSGGCTLMRAGGSAGAAALFAGMAALIDQRHGAQGNMAPGLYALSRQSGVFTDVEQGNAELPCAAASPGCGASGEIGYAAATGYDLATGLGAPNAEALVQKWATAEATGTGAVSVTLSVLPTEENSTYNPSATVTLTATVISETGGGTPTGTVTFLNTTTGAPVSSSPSTVGANGQASLTVEGVFPDGGNEIVAEYSGDSTYAAANSTPAVTINVQPSTTSLTVVPSNYNPAPGGTITVTVTIAVGAPPAGSASPSGSITLNLDGLPAQSQSPSTSNGATTATFSVTLPSGSTMLTHTLQAVYSGDGNYAESTSPQVSITVNKLATTLTITPATTTPTAGSSLQVSATVAASTYGASQPSGTVSLSMDGAAAGNGTLTPGSPSTATITIPLVGAGTHVLQGTYSGDAIYGTSTSTTVDITAAKGATVTTVTATPAVLSAGTPEVLTATIAPASTASTGTSYTITGTVSFYDGKTQLGTVTVSSNAATLTGVTLSNTASHSITAVYSGDTNWQTSTSAPLVLAATTMPDTVVLTANYTSVGPGQAVVLTATVTPLTTPAASAEQNPTGTVIFYDGTTAIGTALLAAVASSDASTATLTTASLPGGQDTLTAVYQGDLYYDQETSNTVTLGVESFSIAPASTNPATNLNIVQGSSGTASYVVTGLGGFNDEVQVLCQVPQQDDMTCTATPQQVVPTATVTFTVTTFAPGGPATATMRRDGPKPLWPQAGGAALAVLAFFLVPFGRRVRLLAGRRTRTLLALALLLTGLGGAGLGCGGGSGTAQPGTPLGVATLKIVASSYVNTTAVSQSLYLTVNVLAPGETAP